MFQQRDGLLWWSASFQKCAVTWVTGSHTSVRITGLPLGKAGLPGRVEPQDFTAACLSSTVFPAPFLWPPALGTDFNYSKYCIPMHKLFLCQPHFLTLLLASSFSKKPKKNLMQILKVILHLQLLQNIDSVLRVVQNILELILHPVICASFSLSPILALPLLSTGNHQFVL